MQLEKQVVNLELAKKLKELGVEQVGFFWWSIPEGGKEKDYFVSNEDAFGFCDQDGCSFNHARVSAFTVAELGEMLPKSINWGQGFKDFEQIYHEERKLWIVRYYTAGSGISPRMEEAATEADARAKILIYLIENELISVEKINETL